MNAGWARRTSLTDPVSYQLSEMEAVLSRCWRGSHMRRGPPELVTLDESFTTGQGLIQQGVLVTGLMITTLTILNPVLVIPLILTQ